MSKERIQMIAITVPVRRLVTLDRSGNIMAIYRSQAIADNVNTEAVKDVTENR